MKRIDKYIDNAASCIIPDSEYFVSKSVALTAKIKLAMDELINAKRLLDESIRNYNDSKDEYLTETTNHLRHAESIFQKRLNQYRNLVKEL